MDNLQQILEAGMMVLFGTSWPFSILKTYRAKTSKGKSFIFLSLLIVGYLCGMASKIVAPGTGLPWVFYFYLANLIMVSLDLSLCVRYRLRETTLAA